MSLKSSWGICTVGIAVTISLSSCGGSASDKNTTPDTSVPTDSNSIGAASEASQETLLNTNSLTAGCTVPEEIVSINRFHGYPVANIQSDVDADGQLDTVELLTQFAYLGGEYHDSVKARIKVTFANGGVAQSDVKQIYSLPGGHTLHALDLHYVADGFQEIMYDTSFGSDDQSVQYTLIFDDCEFKQASSQTSQQAVYIPLKEYVSDTNEPSRSWGCSRENELLEMKTLSVIKTNARRWTIDSWRLIDQTWEFVDSEFDTGPVSPGSLSKNCLLP